MWALRQVSQAIKASSSALAIWIKNRFRWSVTAQVIRYEGQQVQTYRMLESMGWSCPSSITLRKERSEWFAFASSRWRTSRYFEESSSSSDLVQVRLSWLGIVEEWVFIRTGLPSSALCCQMGSLCVLSNYQRKQAWKSAELCKVGRRCESWFGL